MTIYMQEKTGLIQNHTFVTESTGFFMSIVGRRWDTNNPLISTGAWWKISDSKLLLEVVTLLIIESFGGLMTKSYAMTR